MVDLETTGVDPGCGILTIGAVCFDQNFNELSLFETAVNHEESVRMGFKDNPSTMEWWLKQKPDAYNAAFCGTNPPDIALKEFADWIRSNGIRFIWGNGASFDNTILEAAYKHLDVDVPWYFFNNRCYRTIKALRTGIQLDRVGVHHKALDDAVSQLRHMKKIFNVTGLTLE